MAGAKPIYHVCFWVSECDEENIDDDAEENVRYDWDSDKQVEKRKKNTTMNHDIWCQCL